MTKTFDTARQVPLIVGEHLLHRIIELRDAHHAASVLIVTDAGIAATDLVARVRQAIGSECPVHTFIAPAGEPTVDTVDDGARRVRAIDKPLVIGLGGGTALDIAKLLAALAKSPGPMADYLLARTPWAGRAPSIMIPTTSGTGSEVTRTSIVSDDRGRKQWAWGDALLPDAVILDATLTRSLPGPLTATTGLDAFVHALEATTGGARNALIAAPALQAIRLIGQALPRAVAEPGDLSARQDMQLTACLAGQAIDNGGTGLGHNIGHALGTLYHLPHGLAVALAVEATLEWSIAESAEVFAPAADALKNGSTARALPTLFSALAEAADINAALNPFVDLTMNANDLAATMQAEENAPMANNAARRPRPDDWLPLARATVALFEQRVATVAHRQVSPT